MPVDSLEVQFKMSSIVNKSGVRFAPKARQRRTAAAPPVSSSAKTLATLSSGESSKTNSNVASDNEKSTEEETLHADDPHAVPKNLQVPELGDSSHTLVQDSHDPLNTSTQLHPKNVSRRPSIIAGQVPSIGNHNQRRSSRLDSLSSNSNRVLLKSPFGTGNESQTERRLSTISNDSLNRRMRMNSITAENDPTLQAIKKRRLSSRGSIAKKGGSTHRISIVTKIEPPKEKSASPSDHDIYKKQEKAENDENDEDKKFTIKSLKQLPNKVDDESSSKYQIDEEHFTMAELCKPHLPIGEISENFEKAQEASREKMKRRRERKELREKAKKEFKSIYSLNKEQIEQEREARTKKQQELQAQEESYDSQPAAPSSLQVKLVDGRIELDSESTYIDRHDQARKDNMYKERKYGNPFENLYNSATYGKNNFTDPWTADELVKFYKALSMWGTDFNLIAQMFPYRTRKQVKSKFINEEKKHPIMIELALRSKLPPNFDEYCSDIKKELGTVDEFNKKVEELQKEHEQHFKEIEQAKAKAALEDSEIERKKMENQRSNKKSSGGFMTDDLKVYRKQEVVLGTIDEMKMKRVSKQEDEEDI